MKMMSLTRYSISDLVAVRELIKKKLPTPPDMGDYKKFKEQYPIYKEQNKELLNVRDLLTKEINKRVSDVEYLMAGELKNAQQNGNT